MTPMQIKLAVYGGVALLLWLFGRKSGGTSAPADPGRVTKTLTIVDDVNSPYFGMTVEEVAAARGNPAVDPDMHRLIDQSNLLIANDEVN
jgi:hypothetical protein